MVIGKLKWFGGFNKKIGKVNNHGYIEVEKSSDILVKRNNIPIEIQGLLESREGEGIYLEFEIDESGYRPQAINVRLQKLIGIVKWFSKGRGYITVEGREDIRIESSQVFSSGDILYFSLRYNAKHDNDQAESLILVDESSHITIIGKCLNSSEFAVSHPFIINYIIQCQLSDKEAINLILNKVEKTEKNNLQFKKFIGKAFQTLPWLFSDSPRLREYLDTQDYCRLLNELLETEEEHQTLVFEIFEKLRNSNEHEKTLLWSEILFLQRNLGYKNNLWELTPIPYQKKATEDYYKKLFNQTVIEDNYKEVIPILLEQWFNADEWEREIIILQIKSIGNLFLIYSQEVRNIMLPHYTANDYCDFINTYFSQCDQDMQRELLDGLITRLQKSSLKEQEQYWEKIEFLQDYLQYRNGLFWEVAPIKYKRKVIQNKFQYFLSLVADFQNSDYPYAHYISRDWRSLYTLNKSEYDLIFKWDKTVRANDNNAAKMISARGAEKLVMEFYRNMGYQVEDISIHQVTDETSEDWKVGDIRVDNQVLIDVKNARKDFNSSVYSEFCIPRFKKEREQDVRIAGVFSPYLKKTDIDSKQRDNSHGWFSNWRNPQFIGVCNKSIIQSLEEHFTDTITTVNIQRENNPNEYLPPWLFDYGYSFYVEQYKIIEKFRLFQESEMPTWDDLNILEINKMEVLHLFIAAKKAVPKIWSSYFPLWKVNFINDLVNIPFPRLTLPYLFLSILKHFISMLSYEGDDFSPEEYKHLCSLKSIYDPLDLIRVFCTSLLGIWQYREKANLHEFKIFKFNGKGLLTGQRSREQSSIRLLAYCGGKLEERNNAKCGNTPLVIGKNSTCKYCKWLICDKCGSCWNECPRKRGKTQKKIQPITRSPLSFSSFDDDIPF